jgi:methyltransferase-like protein/SAM-dependent methyltransferase
MDANKQANEIQQNYDDYPYYSFPYEHSAPEHLAAVAHVFGLSAPDTREARVLELGCAAGGNLIPFAVRNPDARAIGVDLSGVQVQEGRKRVKRLKLKNVELRQQDLMTLGEVDGQFDYIVCHGVYSWVSPDVQQAILRICRENLSADGIAYIGYKTYPGWKSREIVRDAMLLRAHDLTSGRERLAYGRGMIDFLREHASKESLLARAVERDRALIGNVDTGMSAYVAHDYLAPVNAPCYLQDFAKRADEQGLAYLGDANLPSMFAFNYGDEIGRLLMEECAHSQVAMEQYMDFVCDRSFRTSLLVHKARADGIAYRVGHERLRALHVAASLTCANGDVHLDDSPQPFNADNGNTIVFDDAVAKAAAVVLDDAWPFTMSFDALKRDVQTLLSPAMTLDDIALNTRLELFINALVVRGLGRFRLQPVTRGAGKPSLPAGLRAYPALLPVGQLAHTVNPWHQPVQLDAAAQFLLPYLDGSRTRKELLGMLSKAVQDGALSVVQPASEGGETDPHAVLSNKLEQVLELLCI